LAQQLIDAEATSLRLHAGMAMGHALTGGRLLATERSLDLSIPQLKIDWPSRGGEIFHPSLNLAVGRAGNQGGGNREEALASILMMASKDGKEGGGGAREKRTQSSNRKPDKTKTESEPDLDIQPPEEAERSEVQIRGWVDLRQFYGRGGGSDADTVKLKLEPTELRWRAGPDEKWRPARPGLLKSAQ